MPFTPAEFFAVFERYNLAVWPAQLALLVLAALVTWLARDARGSRGRAVLGAVAVLWLWAGLAYHVAFFRAINPIAAVFGAVFVAQAALLVRVAVRDDAPTVRIGRDLPGVVGTVLVATALVVYPAAGYVLGQRYPAAPTFGLPCPTTIFTLGVLLWVRPRAGMSLLLIPLAWAVVGTSAALQLGVGEDLMLPASAVAAVVAWMFPARGHAPPAPRSRQA